MTLCAPMERQNAERRTTGETRLIADIGATNARFALVQADGTATNPSLFALDDYPGIADAITAFLTEQHLPANPSVAALAIAAPVISDQVRMTNHPWAFSIDGLRRQFNFKRLHVINDLTAQALAIPQLTEDDRIGVGKGTPVSDAPVGIIGPGTGLGVSALIPSEAGAIPIQGEGGHVTMAPADDRESAVLDRLRQRYDHVSAERVLSGPGLINLYNALCELSGLPSAALTAAEISSERMGQEDARAGEATAMFCAMLGTVASNLALTLGARGGIYIVAGIVPKLAPFFARSRFRERFEAKGWFRSYLVAIPTYVVTRPLPALLGAATLLQNP